MNSLLASLTVHGRVELRLEPGPATSLTFAGRAVVVDLDRLPQREEIDRLAQLAAHARAAFATAASSASGPGAPASGPSPTPAPGPSSAPGPITAGRRAILQADQTLRSAGFDAELRVAGRTLARLGPNARAGITSHLMGLAPVEIHALPSIVTLVNHLLQR